MQKLIEQYRTRQDVQFLTLNEDDNPGIIEPFLEEHQLNLSVLPTHGHTMVTVKLAAIPQNWIMDAKGMVRLKGLGYDRSEKWETGMKEVIEKYSGTAGVPRDPRIAKMRKNHRLPERQFFSHLRSFCTPRRVSA